MSAYDQNEFDDILSDVKRLLDEEPPAGEPARRPPVQNAPPAGASARPEHAVYDGSGSYAWNDPNYTGAYYGGAAEVVSNRGAAQPGGYPGAPNAAYPPPAGYPGAYNTAYPPPAGYPAAPNAAYPSPGGYPGVSSTVYPSPGADHAQPWPETAPERRPKAAPRTAARRAAGPRPDEYGDEPAPRPRRRRGRKVLLVLLLVAALIAGACYLLIRPPVGENPGLGERKSGVSTILLIGTDAGGERTDTMMLLSLNKPDKTASLVSIPRDTLVNGDYSPKINGVYGVNGGGEEGVDMVFQRVSECIGFRPDGYVLVDLEGFVSLVDVMGGVEFDVPMDMYYDDPYQDLHIDLSAGQQLLDGVQAMGLVRFRSGYALADLERVNVQRAFVSAAAEQWMNAGLALKAPQLLDWLGDNVETDLSTGNLIWMATALMRADLSAVATETLPGEAVWIGGTSYYALHPYDVAALTNRCLNPYERDITVDDLSIRAY